MIALTYKLSTMNVAFWDSSSDLFQFMQFNDMSIIIESIKVIIIEMCASISLLVSKAKDLTVRSTFLVSITVALALISFLIIPNIKMPLSWLLVIFY
jgi:SET domain-containing protein